MQAHMVAVIYRFTRIIEASKSLMCGSNDIIRQLDKLNMKGG
jgi:hypothetical protein